MGSQYLLEGNALALSGGGWLIGIPNPGETVAQVTLGGTDMKFPTRIELFVAPNACPFLLMDYPLSTWGIDGRIRYATAELIECQAFENVLQLTFAIDSVAEIELEWSDAYPGDSTGWQVEEHKKSWRLWATKAFPTEVEFVGLHGKRLIVRGMRQDDISDLKKAGLDAAQVGAMAAEAQELDISSNGWRMISIDPCSSAWFADAKLCESGKLHLEENSIFRGYGWYRAAGMSNNGGRGLLLRSAADVLSVYLNNNYLGTLVPGGGDAYIPLPDELKVSSDSHLVVRAETWGHTNFDDHRLPALRLHSMKGIAGVVVVHKTENITPNWFYQHRAQAPVQYIDSFWPLIYFGGWSTTDEPQRGVYYREVCFEKGMDARVLSFPGLQVNARVFLNGQQAGMVNPFSPFLDVSLLSGPGETATISVVVEQNFRRSAGQVVLYEGKSVQEWEVAGWNDIELPRLAQKYQHMEKAVDFPIRLHGGELAWLHIDLPTSLEWEKAWNLKFVGQGIKVSAWIGRHMIGRVWLPSEMRPHMAGGADDRMILPSAWVHEGDGQLWLLLESVSQEGELSNVNFAADA